MKPSIALVALLIAACGGSSDKPGPTPTDPPPTGPTPVAAGEWGRRTPLLAPNSELAFAELNRKLYLLGGYPSSRQTVPTVQVYDIASDAGSSDRRSRSPTTTGWRPASTEKST